MWGWTVLPMGWSSAAGLMQAAHREIALRAPTLGGAGLAPLAEISRSADFPSLDEEPGWSIYLDDTTVIEKVQRAVAEELSGSTAAEQEQLRAAYEWWGIPRNTGKAMQRMREAERLGALIDGRHAVLRVRTQRMLDLMALGAYIRSMRNSTTKALQVWAGKMVHVLQFRRCLFSGLEEIFRVIARGRLTQTMTGKLAPHAGGAV